MDAKELIERFEALVDRHAMAAARVFAAASVEEAMDGAVEALEIIEEMMDVLEKLEGVKMHDPELGARFFYALHRFMRAEGDLIAQLEEIFGQTLANLFDAPVSVELEDGHFTAYVARTKSRIAIDMPEDVRAELEELGLELGKNFSIVITDVLPGTIFYPQK